MTDAATLERKLEQFHATHPVRERRDGDLLWRYYAGGPAGAPVLLFLAGGLGRADFAFQVIALLEERVRVLAPDYPPARSLDEICAGLVGILDAERIERVHVVGGSFGGFLAQALVRRAPARVASLVLSHTGAPDGVRRDGLIRVVRLLPARLIRGAMRARLGRTLAATDAFWRAFFNRIIDTLSKEDMLSRMRVQAEFATEGMGGSDPAIWTGPVLILEASDDPLFPENARRKLRAMFPQAVLHEFRDTGHAAALLQPEEYVDVVARFVVAQAGRPSSSTTRPAGGQRPSRFRQ